MASFRYNAKDRGGRSVTGVVESPDERTLIELLRKQDLVLVSIRQEKKREKVSLFLDFGGKVKLGELVIFSRQLATMIDSGIPLVQALEILTEQTEHKGLKSIVSATKKDVSSGSSFHEALSRHPKVFSPLFINMVKAGESSGALDAIMDRLAQYLEKTDSLV
ncbi:MAG: type II secretion system F family protein, partial [Candidatus Omnitrophota bacterium]